MLLRSLVARLGGQIACSAESALQQLRSGSPAAALRRHSCASSGDGASASGSNGGGGGGDPSNIDEAFRKRMADLAKSSPMISSLSARSDGSGGGGGGGGAHARAAAQPPPGGPAAAAAPAGGDGAAAGGAAAKGGPHPQYGYAILGGVNPETADQEAGGAQPKLHPRKDFRPGDTYDPQDLNPFGGADEGDLFASLRRPGGAPRHRPEVTAADARAGLDFRNTAMLRHFVSESGRLRPRRQTGLPKGLHRRAAKCVKLARQMALLPFEMTVGDAAPDARARMMEYEAARRSHRRGKGGGPARGGGGGARGEAGRPARAG